MGGRTQPNGGQTPATAEMLAFKDLNSNDYFYFFSDTNRTYLWVKLPSGKASNTVNSAVASIPDEVQVKRQ